jgi:hypothetical protein
MCKIKKYLTYEQYCGTLTIFYVSDSDFIQVMVTVPVPAPYIDHKKQLEQIGNEISHLDTFSFDF